MTTETSKDDFSLTYKDVQQILGIKKRTIQDLVSNNQLERRFALEGSNGKLALFSKSQVEELARERGVRKGGAEPPHTDHTSGGSNSAMQVFESFSRQIKEKEAELLIWVEKAGKLEGEAGQMRHRLAQALNENRRYKSKIAKLEPRIEALTAKLHKEEVVELQTKVTKVEKSRSLSNRFAWVSVIVILLAVLFVLTNDAAIANIQQALSSIKL